MQKGGPHHGDDAGGQQGLRVGVAQDKGYCALAISPGHHIENPRKTPLAVEDGVQQHKQLEQQRAPRQVPAAERKCTRACLSNTTITRVPDLIHTDAVRSLSMQPFDCPPRTGTSNGTQNRN